MSRKPLRRSSEGNLLQNEMRSWRRNKMEDRRLTMKNEKVDKHMLDRRKSHQHEKDLINKDFEQKISKVTPTMDEYLDRSYHRYNAWRERERERLDRRYRSLHKSYMKEYKNLSIHEYAPKQTRKASETDVESEVAEDQSNQNDNVDAENTDEDDFDLNSLELLNIDMSRRRFSAISEQGPPNIGGGRRKSTGSIALTDISKLKLLASIPANQKDSTNGECDTQNNEDANLGNTENKDTNVLKANTNETPILENVTMSNSGFKTSRRASIAVTPNRPCNLPPLPLGKRLDRRSSIPNIAIPLNYGN